MFAAPWSLVAFDDATGEVAGYLLSSRYEHDWPILGYSAGYTELGVDTANPSGAHGLHASLGYEAFHGSTLVTIEL